ncbi:MAG TPA: CorA family divalent cation transporter [Gemmatimonadales bacterium]|jgi:magnesium transporter
MTVQTVLERSNPRFAWLDLIAPTEDELAKIAEQYGLHATSMQDCLDPEHLPKHEQFEGHAFVILRAWDEQSGGRSTTVQELTRKVAIFTGPTFLITIHRKDQPWLAALREKFRGNGPKGSEASASETLPTRVLTSLLNAVVDTYTKPLEGIEARLDAFEGLVFSGLEFAGELREIHLLKRQVTMIKRLLWRTVDVVQRLSPASGRSAPLYRDVQDNTESSHFYADELLDDVNTLLNIQLALASHRTGEVMRVLTVFSVFFLPLTFIVGVYGMNFEYMPELRTHWGYPAALAAMGIVTLTIFLWFRSRGWLRG